MKKRFNKKGFALIEVLLVIVVISILAGIMVIAIDPAKQIAQSNNKKRSEDLLMILDAIHQYKIDNRGVLPSIITASPTIIGNDPTEIDLCEILVPKYLEKMPIDPTDTNANYKDCNDYNTVYSISSNTKTGTLTASAPSAELEKIISITRQI